MTDQINVAVKAIELALKTVPKRLAPAVQSVELQPLRSLLAECEALLDAAPAKPPIRTVHHFACTGGTLIARTLATQPNVMLLSEIDPLSTLMVRPKKPGFAPTDLIHGLRHALRRVQEPVLSDMFLASLDVLYTHLHSQGMNLVLRDHAHSQYCVERDPADRPSLRELVSRRFRTCAIMTVRHPLDSYLSLVNNNWQSHMNPSTLDAYSQRYLMFLDDNRTIPRFRYEDFTADPAEVMASICQSLDLDYDAAAMALLPIAHLSGDSGRRGRRITLRSRREIPEAIEQERKSSQSYLALCAALGYDE